MEYYLLLAAIAIVIIIQIILNIIVKNKLLDQNAKMLNQLKDSINDMQKEDRLNMLNYLKENKDDYARAQKSLREEINNNIELFKESVSNVLSATGRLQQEKLDNISKLQQEKLDKATLLQKEKLEQIDKTQLQLIESTQQKLENIRATVEEKLDKTLSERLGQSFNTVGKQLIEVQQGLGEMKNLAQDVGGLKKVLSNVKMRGGLGEVQLQMLLENILAPGQFESNVITKKGSREVVEFAIKLPGKDNDIKNIWLPIDAKFPKDVYDKLQNAYDMAEQSLIDNAQKELDSAIKQNAKDISSKYIDVPYTTNFAIMFLPFEGIFAEVVRKAHLLEEIQKKYNVIITGPTTLSAILNSLQIGFKTLAIQKRSNQVWETLSAVKTEFDNFSGILDKARTKIQGGISDIDTLVGTRTRAIQRKLQSVEELSSKEDAQKIIGN